MQRKPLAFLTMDCLDDFIAYDHFVKPPLAELGWSVVDVPWRHPDVQWDDFQAVIIRTPWDYHQSLPEFLQVIDRIDQSSARLFNSAAIIRWNVDKQYLKSLQQRGLVTVPTHWIASPTEHDVIKAMNDFSVDEIVIKPTIGAGARDTFRIKRNQPRLLDESLYHGRTTMLQPFLSSVVERGEWSLFYFANQYSHTVLKTPRPGDFRAQEEHGSHLQAVSPSTELIAIANQAMDAIFEPTLYARVDIVHLQNGEPAIMELELIEPSLYFSYDDQAPKRFANAIDLALRSAG
jgi:glutathione synthase/RimK-type ligase-like ATP-grasp enzyme